MKTYNQLLREYLTPIQTMKLKFPKAAKRRRILKKWENRFGTAGYILYQNITTPRRTFTGDSVKPELWHSKSIITVTGV